MIFKKYNLIKGLKITSKSIYIYIHTYIHTWCGVIIWAKFGLLRCYYLGQVCLFFFTKHCSPKNTIKKGVSAFLKKKKNKNNCARKFEVLLSGPSWPFLSCSQLGPDNNTYLAQIITPQNGLYFQFLLFKNVLKYLFYSVFEHQPKLGKKGAKKTITFHILQNTGWRKKKRFVATPLFTKNSFFLVVCFETKNIHVEQKT